MESHGQEPEAQGGHAVTVGIYANTSLHLPALTTYVNVLSVILVSYHLFLLLLPSPPASLLDDGDDDSTVDEMAERYKVGVNAREGERTVAGKRRGGGRERKEDDRRGEEEEGPAFQSPVSTRDPRPLNHPPQLGRNSVLFSPLLCSFLLFFLPPRFSPPFFYLSPLPFSTFSTGPRRQPTDPPPPPSSSSSSPRVHQCSSGAFFDGRELWEKHRRPARPVTKVTGHNNESFVRIRLDL